MRPIKFKGYNEIIAENQPEYIPLPAFMSQDGIVVSCWQLTFKEKLKLLFTGKLWLTVLTFNSPLQPQLPEVNCPLKFSEV